MLIYLNLILNREYLSRQSVIRGKDEMDLEKWNVLSPMVRHGLYNTIMLQYTMLL